MTESELCDLALWELMGDVPRLENFSDWVARVGA